MCRTPLVNQRCERHPSVGGLTLHHQGPNGARPSVAHEDGSLETKCAPGAGLRLATPECGLAPVGEHQQSEGFVQRLHICKDGKIETYIRRGPLS